jgi:hypothetical protein
MCNKHAQSLQRIFIHLPCDNEDNEDDDSTSLSSCATTESDGNDNNESGPIVDPENERNEIDDKAEDDDLKEDVVDLVNSPPEKRRHSSKNKENDAAEKVRRKAKRLKTRVKMLESQRKEFVEKEQKLMQQHVEAKERFTAIDAEFKLLKSKVHEDKLELEHRRLEVVKIRADRDAARASLQSTTNKLKSLEAELNRLRQNFNHNLSQAQAHGMAEAQLLKEQHQQLGDENNKLKQAVLLKDSQMHDMNRQLQRMQHLIQGKVDISMNDLASNSRKRAAKVGKSFLEAENMLSAQREEEDRLRAMVRDERVELQSRMKSKISHQAARFSAAVGKQNALRDKQVNDGVEVPQERVAAENVKHKDSTQRAIENKAPTPNPHPVKASGNGVSLNLCWPNKRGRAASTVTSSSRALHALPPIIGEQRPKKKQSTITTMFKTRG